MSANTAITFVWPVIVQHSRERGQTGKCAASENKTTVTMAIMPINGLMFPSGAVDGMNVALFNNFLADAKTNLDPYKSVISVFDGVLAHRNPAIPAPNTELKMLPHYSPLLM